MKMIADTLTNNQLDLCKTIIFDACDVGINK